MTARRWALLAAVGLGAGLVWFPAPASAHGIGGRSDLPVPLEFFLIGAGVVLVLSFAALAVLWPEPRWQGEAPLRTLGGERFHALAAALLAAVGLAGIALVVAAGLFGEEHRNNVAPVLVWVYFWLVVPFASALVGNLWRHLNPWRTATRLLRIGDQDKEALPAGIGVWPAVVAFVAFTWLELVYPDSGRPRVLAVAALIYTIYVLYAVGSLGRRQGLRSVEAFTVYNGLIASVAPIGRDPAGGLAWRGWLRRLPALRVRPGLTAFVIAMIGTVTYDGLSSTPWWSDTVGADLAGTQWFGTIALVGTIAVIGAGYWSASWLAARLSGVPDATGAAVARSFTHTLVPIALAYAVAHYFTLVIFEGQLLLSALSDPFGRGWDLFGTADRSVSFFLSPTAVWYVQVVAIVAGHVAAVVLAHDRALADFPPERAVQTQYAMLGLMVALTVLGLTLLAAG